MKDAVNRTAGAKETFTKGTKYYLIGEPEQSGVKAHECKSDGLKKTSRNRSQSDSALGMSLRILSWNRSLSSEFYWEMSLYGHIKLRDGHNFT
jgi:hypothetical protein